MLILPDRRFVVPRRHPPPPRRRWLPRWRRHLETRNMPIMFLPDGGAMLFADAGGGIAFDPDCCCVDNDEGGPLGSCTPRIAEVPATLTLNVSGFVCYCPTTLNGTHTLTRTIPTSWQAPEGDCADVWFLDCVSGLWVVSNVIITGMAGCEQGLSYTKNFASVFPQGTYTAVSCFGGGGCCDTAHPGGPDACYLEYLSSSVVIS